MVVGQGANMVTLTSKEARRGVGVLERFRVDGKEKLPVFRGWLPSWMFM